MRKSQRKVTYIPDTGDLDAPYCSGGELMDATATVVSTLSRNNKTKVTFKGDRACTNGREVQLPALPENAVVTKRQGLVTGGYANHEALHNLLTEFSGETEDMCQRWGRDGRKLTLSLANAMEDVRIEMGGRDLYNGLPKAIDKTSHEVNTRLLRMVEDGDIGMDEFHDFASIGSVAVTWEGRKRLGYPSETQQQLLDMLSDDVRDRVVKIVDAIQHLDTGVTGMGEVDQKRAYQGCIELHKLAEKIVDDYTAERNEDDGDGDGGGEKGTATNPDDASGRERGGETGEQSGNPQREGDQGDDGSATDADPTGSSGNGTQVDGERQPDQGTQKPADFNGGADGNDEWREVDTNPISAEMAQGLESVLGEMQSTPNGYRVYNRQADKFIISKGKPFKDTTLRVVDHPGMSRTKGEILYAASMKQMGNKLGTMRRKLERALMSTRRVKTEGGKRSGRLDTRKLVSIAQFQPNVFRSRVESQGIDTALSICVDMSGSMGGKEISLAQDCCIAIGEALNGTNVALEITGHRTYEEFYRGNFDQTLYNRRDSINMYMFKQFNSTMKQSRRAIGNMCNMTGGANADGDSWLYAIERLAQRPERRKVFLAMSDGRPSYSSDCNDQRQHTSDCVAYIQSLGIEVVGIGILDDCVRAFFPRYVVVNNLDELSKSVMDQIGKLLIGERFAVDNSDLIKGVASNAK